MHDAGVVRLCQPGGHLRRYAENPSDWERPGGLEIPSVLPSTSSMAMNAVSLSRPTS